ncbi:PREDICTED: rho GTPase-activating protein gacV-like [Trachymyrmex cornetzi]|uniref:rho GTPase-activating protein gacV-like n=1 Tax=Trachymyrmex cornetzi TaxID=471704 RepID=UPI00084F6E1D|nr:PREDICTED: rho GTPase-activating protein gacV-like [Trachymyrmex cornetzi]
MRRVERVRPRENEEESEEEEQEHEEEEEEEENNSDISENRDSSEVEEEEEEEEEEQTQEAREENPVNDVEQHHQQQPHQHWQHQHQQQQHQRQHEVGDNFNFVDLRTENSRRFRNFGMLGREASFVIQPIPEVVTENPGEGTSSATIQEDVTHASENEPEIKDKFKRDRVAFVFYDFETRQDETYEGTENVKIHVPILCVAHQICETCAEIDDMSVRCR